MSNASKLVVACALGAWAVAACGKSGSLQSTEGTGAEGAGGHETTSTSSSTGAKGSSSSGTSSTSSGGEGGSESSSSSGASTSGASSSTSTSSSSSGSACALPDPTGKTYVGSVLLSRTTTSTPTTSTQYSVLGDLTPAPTTAAPACNGTKLGACCFGAGPAGSTTFESAGTLTVTDAGKTLATLTTPPYVATNATVTTLTWTAGSTIKVDGSGGTVDAFDLSVVAPKLLAGVTPALDAPLTVTKSVKLVVKWTPSTETCSEIEFGLSQASTSGTLPFIGCTADDADGTLTVPEALLAKITATTGTATLERIEAAGINVANANVKMVVTDTLTTTVTFQ
jgi:hypothetical protein